MNHVFQYENISFHYKLIREERKTLSVTVLPTQKIIVKAPLQAPDDRIHALLSRKFRWVLKQQRYFHQFKVEPQKEFVSGETFRYRGRSYKLLVRRTVQNEHVKLQHGNIIIFTRLPGDASHRRRLLEDWYIQKAHEVFPERLMVCLKMFEYVDKPGLMIRQMTRRWGSYSSRTNRVILNRDLIKAATRYIDYVIIHELCHMEHREHSRAFYELLSSKLPQWRRLKEELELNLLGQ